MRKKLNFVVLVMCVCLGAYAQVPPYQRSPWTTNTPGSINAFATNTTIVTNLSVIGPTDSRLLVINNGEFVFSNLNANLGPLGVFGQGKEYGTPANAASGYFQPYSANDGNTRIWNTGPFSIFFATDNLMRMRLDSPGNLGIGGVPAEKLHVFSGNGRVDGNFFVLAPTNGVAPPTVVTQAIGMFGSINAGDDPETKFWDSINGMSENVKPCPNES